jgi:AraC family transcriptional activator of pobA
MFANMDFLYQALRPRSTYMPMHQHNCYELVYYRFGKGTTRIGSVEYLYESNTYTIICPNTPHEERRYEDSDVIFIGFSIVDKNLPPLQEGSYHDESPAPIEKLLLKMKSEMQEKRAYYTEKLNLLVSDTIIEHLRNTNDNPSKTPDDNLYYARTFMDENYNQKMTIDDLAEMVGYSYHHFRHLFKKKFGVSPISYLMFKRLEKARQLLRYTELSVTSIALECGFSNEAQFCTIFKRELGVTSSAFRQNGYNTTLSKSSKSVHREKDH